MWVRAPEGLGLGWSSIPKEGDNGRPVGMGSTAKRTNVCCSF